MSCVASRTLARRAAHRHIREAECAKRPTKLHAGVEGMGKEQRGAAMAPAGDEQVGLHPERGAVHTESRQVFCLPGPGEETEHVYAVTPSQRWHPDRHDTVQPHRTVDVNQLHQAYRREPAAASGSQSEFAGAGCDWAGPTHRRHHDDGSGQLPEVAGAKHYGLQEDHGLFDHGHCEELSTSEATEVQWVQPINRRFSADHRGTQHSSSGNRLPCLDQH